MSHIVKIGEDGVLDIPEEIIEQLGLKEGDKLKWSMREDGTVVLTKADTKFVLVETISTFRHRYVIELPSDDPDAYALDTVACEEGKDFGPEWLGEQIVSHRRVAREELRDLADEYTRGWDDETFMRNLVTLLHED